MSSGHRAVLAPGAAGAQTTTADGARALVRGDYETALRILRPLAENTSQPDPLAQFFMAMLYAPGPRGDITRGCGLYLAAATGTNPLAAQSLTLARAIQDQLRDLASLCVQQMAPDDRPLPSASVTQGPILSASAAVVHAQTTTADGVEAFVRGDYQLAAEILKPIAEKSPLPDHAASFLMGTFYENGLGVAADQTRACASCMRAADPRGSTPFAVAANMLVRAMHESMTLEEFQYCELLASLGFDHGFQPVTFELEPGHWISWDLKGATYVGGNGCGNVFVYGRSDDRTEAIAVRADKSLLQLSTTARTFDIVSAQTGLEVVLHLYERPLRSWSSCGDVGSGMLTEVWRATRGTVTVELSAPGVRAREPNLYRATIRIVGAEFVNGSGARVKQVQPITLTTIVGGVSE